MAKIIFVLQKKRDQTREQCPSCWSGRTHTSIVEKLPVVGAPGEPVCDGIGELWFASDEAMTRALNSPEMAAAVEDARNFLDMDRTGMIVVQEKTIIG